MLIQMPHYLSYSFSARLDAWIRHMRAGKPCGSQQVAYELVLSSWVKANADLGASPEFLRALGRRRLCEEHGWRGLKTGVAYWDLDENQSVRIYLHFDGSIVAQQMDAQNLQILFTLPSAHDHPQEISSHGV